MKLLKQILNITAVYILLSLTFGIETAFITLMCAVVPLIFILVLGVKRSATSGRKSYLSVGSNEHDYWTPGQPAISQKAFTQGFFTDT